MKIGELSEKLGITVEAIRYYEKEGLLCAPDRTASNYRVYGEHHLEDLAFVVFCRGIDISLDEIRSLLKLKHSPRESCEPINEAIDDKLIEIDKRISRLQALRSELQRLRAKCLGHNTIAQCEIIKTSLII
ncbi:MULTISPECIES: MerR family transcriptional regulator [Betaproteobacteria]|jgi:Cd(II)/Pb(II)-responsive transcriptional regulator|uniref:MerR family transcriptional regulator n=1 Tax=Betaproteobacteria TaxID=28216 RepID=UPI000156C208|nr:MULTISPECIES: MerR family transcriptional regulator [Betaproteobacteria]EDM84111.1 Cd(II)/Pb(II)-responsive transcriptional regulator [Limnobacter sp. MED105]MDZ4104559.1 MerR family transcriptional regulator [Nitrosomonas sp.]RZO91341.1 MAG: MerR family transcriptional regulator [Limnobacter sp.]VWX37299.1 HTH-type transcriptional regulator ZntR homolog [Limnobacter sp. 130]